MKRRQRTAPHKARAKSEDEFRLLFNELTSAVALHEIIVDAKGTPIDYRFIDVNPTFETMTGLKRKDVVGKTILSILPETEPYWIERYGRVALTGVHEHFENYAASLKRYYDVRAYCSRPGIFAVVFQDITERKQIEQSVRESELRYRSVIEQTAEGVFMVDVRTKRILEANPAFCQMLGMSAEELHKTRFYSIIAGNLEAVNAMIYHLLDSPQPLTGVQQYMHKDGRVVDVEYSASMLEMRGKRMMVMVVRDMTERKKMEEAARQLQKMESLGVLAAGVAHDFNNLFQVMLGQMSVALRRMDGKGEAPDAAQHLEKARKAVGRAAELTQKLLAYASGVQEGVKERVQLNRVIEDSRAELEAMLPKKAHLVFDLGEAVPDVECGPGAIRNVLVNLVTNAAESLGAASSGTILCATRSEEIGAGGGKAWSDHTKKPLAPGRYAVLTVKDDGCGMSRQTITKLFDPYFSTKFSGRGLGLAEVFGIVRGHRGGLMLESKEGKGTTFRLAFPASELTLEEEEEPMLEQSGNAGRDNEGLVLVVDDEEMVRDVLGDILETSGFRSLTAAGGEEALTLYAERRAEIRVVLLDLSMPGMSGEETYRRLKALDPQANILVSSGYSKAEVQSNFPELAEASAFIQKPYQSDALIKKLSVYFAQK